METNKKKQLAAACGIFIAAILWGFSYPATKFVEDYPTFFILPVRFVIASAALAAVFHRNFTNLSRKVIKQAFLLSFFITAMYVFSTIGIKYTISARASFFTCLTFVFVPIINLLIFRERINKIIGTSIVICFAGVLLLSYQPGMTGLALNIGDILCMIASVAGSLHIIFLGRISGDDDFDPMLFTTLLMGFVALWSALAALLTGSFSDVQVTLPGMGALVFLGLFCSAAAFLLQSICQQFVPANRAGVIFAMEPASGCVASVLLLGESMGSFGWAGAALVLFSSLYMEAASSRKS